MAADKGAQDEYKQFYTEELDLPPSTKDVLVNYSNIPEGKVESHRAKAWSIHPYPCIGMFRFCHLAIGNHALYKSEILPRMLSGQQTYLDLGCAFAQDIRRLVADGVLSEKCYGADLRLDFLNLGYELFNDRQSLKSKFIEADIFDANSGLRELEGNIDIVDASSFFHLFRYHDQKAVARSVIKLLRPQKDSLVVGRQVGSTKPGEVNRKSGHGSMFRHDMASWRKLWEEVGGEVGVKFQVEGELKQRDFGAKKAADQADGGEAGSIMVMEFSVRRLG
ncbi:hypothetical protein LTR62_006678 [Meristemomyces frigidus]|uniref:Methyltransferase domain-containing protein n=1 Tax=Meristemomyces frigidus TaxID=1508187 RepID=A0AAN7YJ20_9PEZI|nr:hypothetical protein LTR62_006678 [Meristemomyces frigidus]